MKEHIMFSLDSEIAQQLRAEAVKKYGTMRSMSKLIEELLKNQPTSQDLDAEEEAVLDREPEAAQETAHIDLRGHEFKCKCGANFAILTRNLGHWPVACPGCGKPGGMEDLSAECCTI